jgi:hypothetical protein
MGTATASVAGPVQFVFTGVVTASGAPQLVGQYVTGTYAFNYNSADQIAGLPGSVSPWAIGSSGVPYNPVFSYTAKIGTNQFQSSPIAPDSDPDDASIVSGTRWTFTASEATPGPDQDSFFTIQADTSDDFPYDNDGYPRPISGDRAANGGFLWGATTTTYKITSLSASPGPNPTAMFSALLNVVAGIEPGNLDNKVSIAQKRFLSNNIPASCQSLSKFLDEVQRKDGKPIDSKVAEKLTDNAQALAAIIGCQPE